jgi:hypothetical protein
MLGACSGGHQTKAPTTPARPSATTGPTRPAFVGVPSDTDWRTLASTLSGRVVRESDRGYLTDLQLYDPRYDDVRPAAIAYCSNPTDVQHCVGFARQHEVPVAVRSGGHSYGGYSTGAGLVVDVTGMSAVSVDPLGRAIVGAGARLIDVYTALNAQGMSIPAGSCPTVGVAGLTLGGGAGVVARAHGLTCDALVGVDVVTADGRLVSADGSMNDDLFWACRGGGGGNFAIVTAFSFAPFSTTDVSLFYLTWTWAAASQVLPAWLSWVASAPNELWSNCVMQTDPLRSSVQLSVNGVFLGPTAPASGLLDALVVAAGSAPATRSLRQASFAQAMYVEAGCAGLSQASCHLPTQVPGGALTRQPSLAKSDFLTEPLPTAGVAAVLAGIDERRASGAKGAVGFDSYGGVVNQVNPTATAFVHRNAIASAQYGVPFTAADGPATLAAGSDWLDQWYASLRPYVSGQAYQNYIDPGLADWQQAYYGINFARLRQVKKSWDPDDFFHFAQSIPLP